MTFFKSLSLKEKISFIAYFTNILHEEITETPVKPTNNNEKERLLKELYGAWEDEDELNENTIINRTVSDREINLDD